MILAVDVHYHEGGATAAGVLFEAWDSAEITLTHTKSIPQVEPYEPGNFYKRELPGRPTLPGHCHLTSS